MLTLCNVYCSIFSTLLIKRIGARRTCTHWDGRQPTRLSGRGLLDMQSTPTGDLAHRVKEEKKLIKRDVCYKHYGFCTYRSYCNYLLIYAEWIQLLCYQGQFLLNLVYFNLENPTSYSWISYFNPSTLFVPSWPIRLSRRLIVCPVLSLWQQCLLAAGGMLCPIPSLSRLFKMDL